MVRFILALRKSIKRTENRQKVIAKGDFLEKADTPFNYDPDGRRDPFMPLVNREGLFFEPVVKKENPHQAETELYLEGIVYEPQGGSCAVINSEIVKAGDKIGDYQVLEVQRQQVVLVRGGEVLNLELRKEDE